MLLNGSSRLTAAVCVAVLLPPALASASRSAPARPSPSPSAPAKRMRGATEEHLRVRRGDTLATLLASRGVSASEAEPWIAAMSRVHDLRHLQPRRGLSLRFDRGRSLEAIRYQVDDRTLLVAERTETGIRTHRSDVPYFTEIKGVAGSITRGLRSDAAQSGLPPGILSELADIFGWEIDLSGDLQSGDEFRVLYENTWQTGSAWPEPGRVLGAKVVVNGEPITAIYFEDVDGRGAYYRPSGTPLSRRFLRYPLQFTKITSAFSHTRLHPILQVARPHLGVDFAAPYGTPVRAVASGTVGLAGWSRQLGRQIRVDHDSGVASSYAHLARFAPGIAPGESVERGQVIGYVGSSGLATGPHLHFAFHRNGKYVDPLRLPATSDAPIPARAWPAFERVRTAVTRQLGTLPKTMSPLTMSLSEAGQTTWQ